jgi:hypothetical protein
VSSCEKCWAASYDPQGDQSKRYQERLMTHKCTPEEQAGPDAQWCIECGGMTRHQHTGQCMVEECDAHDC